MKALVPEVQSAADWAPLAEFVAVDSFERVGTFLEVQTWEQYTEMLTMWASSIARFETTAKRISELPGVVYFEIEERHFRGDTVVRRQLADRVRVRRRRQDPRPAASTSSSRDEGRVRDRVSPVGRGTVGRGAASCVRSVSSSRPTTKGWVTAPLMAAMSIAVCTRPSGPASSPMSRRAKAVHDVTERLVLGEEPDDHGIAQDAAHRVPAVDGEVDDAGDERVAGAPPRGLGLRGSDHRLQPRQLGFGGGQDDLVLGVVLVVHRGLRHADLVGDHLQRRPADAVLGEQLDRRGDDAGLGGGGRRDWLTLIGAGDLRAAHARTLPSASGYPAKRSGDAQPSIWSRSSSSAKPASIIASVAVSYWPR